jgi:hypothetical protein
MQAGQLVTKEALLETIWPATVVSESSLMVAIRTLRRVLDDPARTPRFIETVHGRGYRFIAPVSTLVAPGGPEETLRRVPSSTFRRPPHFVGRDAALAQLAQWWTLARRGTRQVVAIAGEAGIGKTALVNTFVAQVAATEDVGVGHGQCLDHYGAGEVYLPILEALGRLGRGQRGSGSWRYCGSMPRAGSSRCRGWCRPAPGRASSEPQVGPRSSACCAS